MIIHYINLNTLYVSLEVTNMIILLLLITTIILLFLIKNISIIKYATLIVTVTILLSYMLIFFNIINIWTVYENAEVLSNSNKIFYMDNLAILFALMTAFIMPLCVVYSIRETGISVKILNILILILECTVLFCFTTRNLLFFFIAFEFIIIPMMLLILNFGSRGRKLYAFMSFFIYTFIGSIFLLIGIFIIYSTIKTLNFDAFLYTNTIKYNGIILFCFLIGFAIKIPTMPFHSWLPEAHVEAPTIGSVILASLLLKLGGYGVLRVIIPLCGDSLMYWRFLPITICLISSIYATFLAFRQYDTKKIIAYSSIAHMNLSMIGIFMESTIAVIGSILSMLSHSVIAGALFFIAGFLYEKYHTRNVLYYSSSYSSLYIFYFITFFFIFANMSLPGICSFVGELFIYIGIAKINIYLLFMSGCIMFFTGLFSCVLLYRLVYFTSNMHNASIQHKICQIIDLTAFVLFPSQKKVILYSSEFLILLILALVSILLFFFQDLFIVTITTFCYILIY